MPDRKTTPRAKHFTPNLKGGALYIAVTVSSLICVFLSFFILFGRYNQNTVTVVVQTAQLYHNLQSAFAVAQSGYFSEEINGSWIKNAVNDDSLKISRRFWGAYLLLTVYTKNRHKILSQSGLYGTSMNGDTALMVSENGMPTGLSGEIIFKANCYLPKEGIKPAYIEGQNYSSNEGNAAFIKQAPAKIPGVDVTFIKGIKKQIGFNASDSTVAELPATLNQPFTQKTIAWQAPDGRLTQLHLSNNIRITAESLEVDSSCHFNHVLLVCKKVRFKSGFKGTVHVIAGDSIITESNCTFNYPSSLILFSENNADKALRYISFGDQCRFFGAVLAFKNETNRGESQNVFIQLNRQSEVNGLVYSQDYLHLEGLVNGTVICDKLLLKTPSAVYENHLLGCTLDPKKYAGELAVPQVFKPQGALVCCEKIDQ